MKFSWKVFFCTISVVAVAFSIGSYILISSVFQAALEREKKLAIDENIMLRFALETAFVNVPAKYETIQASTIAQISQSVVAGNIKAGHLFRLSDEQYAPVYTSGNVSAANALLDKASETAVAYQVIAIDGDYFIQSASQTLAANKRLNLETFRNITPVFQERSEHFAIYRRLMAAMLTVVSVVMLLISFWLTRPIRALSAATKALAEGDLHKRLTRGGDDEIGSLTNDFNRMAAALEGQVFTLQQVARQKEEFAASFAHELKTPLTSIIGYADMIRSLQLDGERQFCAANYIFNEGKRLESLALKLMDLLVLNKSNWEKKAVYTSVLFESMAETFGPVLAPKNILLIIEYDKAVVMAEADLMKTLLVNLIDNAHKVTATGGRIEFSGKSTEQGYIFRVKDVGCGIAHNELSKITEPFYMVDKSRSREQNGAGLGLALCSEIAALHQTRLVFESQPGCGTVVSFLLAEEGGK